MAAAEELQIKGLAKGTCDQIAEPPSLHLQPGLDTNADPEAAFSANFGQRLSVSPRDHGEMTEKEEYGQWIEEIDQRRAYRHFCRLQKIKDLKGPRCHVCNQKTREKTEKEIEEEEQLSAYRRFCLLQKVKGAKCHVCEHPFKYCYPFRLFCLLAYKRNEHEAKLHGIPNVLARNFMEEEEEEQ